MTTTPRDNALLREILADERTETTSAPTSANEAFLARSFLEYVHERYNGTRLGRQELEGQVLTAPEGALWKRDQLDLCRGAAPESFTRIVVAVDPPVTSKATSDQCGIIVAGLVAEGPPKDWRVYVLEDASLRAAPTDWAKRVVAMYEKHQADRVVAEVNQGGDLVAAMIHSIDPTVAYTPVTATKGKVVRAEPVAALYEQGRVFHAAPFEALEDQMCAMTVKGYVDPGSPDRADALVWAVTELLVSNPGRLQNPSVRPL